LGEKWINELSKEFFMHDLMGLLRKRGLSFLLVIFLIPILLVGCLGKDINNNSSGNPLLVTQTATFDNQAPSNNPTSGAAAPSGGTQLPNATQLPAGTAPAGGTQVPGGTTQTIPTTQGVQPGQGTAPAAAGSIPVTGSGQDLQTQYVQLYQQSNPGVVNLRLDVNSNGQSGVALGSGWIYDGQGDIVTNNHVVADGTDLVVTFFDGFQMPAQVVGTDPYSDLAVVRVQQLPKNVHTLKPSSRPSPQVGEVVVAIGSPFGLGSTMTTGIVSALGREISSLVNNFSIPEAIQTDASINPGNSGGPLIDLNGEVIGVNSQIATNGSSDQSSGVGFAIPIGIVNRVVPSLISQGKYSWPYLGVAGTSVDLMIQQANKLPSQQGAYIDQVTPGGPAEQAGLQGSNGNANVMHNQVPTGGDVIVAINGQPIATYDALLTRIAQFKPGDAVTLSVLRDGQKKDVIVKLVARPSGLNQNGANAPQ
jgi:S1-C subfamily serine protease